LKKISPIPDPRLTTISLFFFFVSGAGFACPLALDLFGKTGDFRNNKLIKGLPSYYSNLAYSTMEYIIEEESMSSHE